MHIMKDMYVHVHVITCDINTCRYLMLLVRNFWSILVCNLHVQVILSLSLFPFIFQNKDEHVADGALLYYPAAKGNVEKLKDACNKSYHCVGFSTSGILKRSVDQPSSWRYSGDSMYLLGESCSSNSLFNLKILCTWISQLNPILWLCKCVNCSF